MRRAAVTGAAGVIGRVLVERLARQGVAVLALDRAPPSLDLRTRCDFVRVDLADGGMEEIAAFEPDTVFHLAAAFERSVETPEFFAVNHRDNVLVTHRLHATLPRLARLERYVFASSYLIYRPELYQFDAPQAAARPLREHDPIEPRNLCGVAKYLGEREIAHLAHAGRIRARTIAARIYRVYGRGSGCVVSRWVRSLLAGEPITVFNPDGRFDYVFADDAAEGLVRLAVAPAAEGVVNLASGTAPRVAEVVEHLRRRLDPDAGLIRYGEDAAPWEASCADVGRLRAATGWVPSTAPAEGIDAVIAHERARRALAA